jgi:hypothetical protein
LHAQKVCRYLFQLETATLLAKNEVVVKTTVKNEVVKNIISLPAVIFKL